MLGDWEGVPGEWVDDSTAIDGKRFLASRRGVTILRSRMREAAKGRCEWCRALTWFGDRHHVYGRGAGGGKREDRPWILAVQFVVWLCRECHEVAKIRPWGSWVV